MDNLNKGLMTFAAYNAGPGRLKTLRRETEKRGLDPNVWFGNVEQIASERIGRETVQYVSNIHKYYVAYTLSLNQGEQRGCGEGASRKAQKVNERSRAAVRVWRLWRLSRFPRWTPPSLPKPASYVKPDSDRVRSAAVATDLSVYICCRRTVSESGH
jgi:hypothetical protein